MAEEIIYSFGWIRDAISEEQLKKNQKKYEFVKTTFADNIDTLSGLIIKYVTPTVYSQGRLSSCTACAVVAAYKCQRERLPGTNPDIFSCLFVYFEERLREGNIGQDCGAMIHTGINVIKDLGTCFEHLWNYGLKFTDRPSTNAYDDAKNHHAIEAWRVPQEMRHLKQMVIDGHLVVFGFQVYQSMTSPYTKSTGFIQTPGPGEKCLGGHAVYIIGFDNNINGGSFIIRNSWGESWGNHANGYIRYEYVLNSNLATDFWAIGLVKA